MQVTIKYFASLRELMGESSRIIDINEKSSVDDIWQHLTDSKLIKFDNVMATINIEYVPKEKIVELKSLKLYINRFRNEEHFHEEVVNLILDDFLICCDPKWIKIGGDFNVRGNIKTKVHAIHGVKPSICN